MTCGTSELEGRSEVDMIIHDCPHCGTKGAGLKLQHPGVHYGQWDYRQVFEVLARISHQGP